MKTLIAILVIITTCCCYVFGVDHIFTLPIQGNFTITAGWYYPPEYGGGNHFGIDYSTVPGTKILAVYGGEVIEVQKNIPDDTGSNYGNYIIIDHGNGYRSRYAHMLYNSANVYVGDYIYQGKFIGRVGNTGNSTGPHLHFDCTYNNIPIDTYGWYSNNVYQYRNGCNPNEYYFVSNPPTLPFIPEQSRILPDDLLVHLVGTPNYYWIKDGQMRPFNNETPFYTWGFDWNHAVDISQEEFSGFPLGQVIAPKVGTCVYDQNYQRWVFDYQSDNSTTIVKRRVNNWQQLGYSADVWIPTTNSYLSQFPEGPQLVYNSNYPYGTVLRSGSSMNERYVIKRGAEISSQYAGQKMLLRIVSDSAYFINYYHPNFNIVVTQSVLNYYQIAPFVSYEKIMDGKLISGSGPACYYIENGLKRLISDELTFDTYGFNFANVFQVSDNDINSFLSGENIQYFAGGGNISYQGGTLEDGGFDSGTCNYWLFNDSQQVGNFNVTTNDCINGFYKAEIHIANSVGFYQEELMQLVSIEAGKSYHLSFFAKSNPVSGIKVCIQNHSSPWNNYGLWKEINLSNAWTKYQYIFQANTTDPMVRLDFMIGQTSGYKYFDNVIFEEIPEIQTQGDNLIRNPGFELGHFAPFVMGDLNSTASYYTDESVYHTGTNSMFIDPNQTGFHYEVQLYQNIEIVSGTQYTLSFWAKAQSQRNVKLELYNENFPWNNFGLWQVLNIGTQWQNYSVNFIATSSGLSRISWNLGEQDIPIWLDDVVLTIQAQQISNMFLKEFKIYPNPFNSVVSISFDTEKDSDIEISIYNIKGQLVRILNSSELKSGKHTINWDSKDGMGNICSSGIYICRIKTNDFSMIRKIIFSK